jgi:hypothetical protein
MLSIALKLSFLLIFICSAAVASPHLLPYDDSALRSLIIAEADCSMPCWQHIRLGSTSLDEALTLLEQSDLVGEVQKRVGYRHIWVWSDQRPSIISETGQQFLFSWREDIAETISMQNLPPSWHFWLLLGRPDNITVAPMNDSSIAYIASYTAEQIHIFNFASCDARSGQVVWEQASRLDIGRLVFYPTARPLRFSGQQWLSLFHAHPFC